VKRGETLIQAKPLLKAQRRKFGEWLDLEAGLQPRTAQLLMSVARLAAKEPDSARDGAIQSVLIRVKEALTFGAGC
jgi:hypothetical protein